MSLDCQVVIPEMQIGFLCNDLHVKLVFVAPEANVTALSYLSFFFI